MPLKINLYSYQKKGVDFIESNQCVIVGDEMGLGKSAQALALADRLSLKTLIVCPAFLQPNWKNETEKLLHSTGARFEFMSYDVVYKTPSNYFKYFDFIVADEFHYLKNPTSRRTQAFLDRFTAHPTKYFAGLSGTPIKNRVTEFWSLLNIMSKSNTTKNGHKVGDFFRSYTAFCEHFSNPVEMRVNGFKIRKYVGAKNLDDLKNLLDKKYIRRKATDELDLPDLVYKSVRVSITVPTNTYVDLKQDFENENNLSTAKAKSALAKAEFTVKYVAAMLEEVEKVVVFSDHVAPVETIFKALTEKGVKCEMISGQVSTESRSKKVDAFERGDARVLVATIGALKEGVNLTSSNNLIFNDLSWVPANNAQVEKRIHRIGQKNKCTIHKISSGVIDDLIIRTLANKQRELNATL